MRRTYQINPVIPTEVPARAGAPVGMTMSIQATAA
jgi:hypothetical protein